MGLCDGIKRVSFASRHISVAKHVKLENQTYCVTFDKWGGCFTFRSHGEDLIYAMIRGDIGSNGEPIIDLEKLQVALDEGVIRGMMES